MRPTKQQQARSRAALWAVRGTRGHRLGDDRFYKTPYIGQHGWVTVSFHALAEPAPVEAKRA